MSDVTNEQMEEWLTRQPWGNPDLPFVNRIRELFIRVAELEGTVEEYRQTIVELQDEAANPTQLRTVSHNITNCNITGEPGQRIRIGGNESLIPKEPNP